MMLSLGMLAMLSALAVLPASASACVSQERQQGTHVLLLLTPMRRR